MVWMALASACALIAAESSTNISLSQLPAAAQTTVKQQLAGAVVVDIEKNDEDGNVSWTVTKKEGNAERYFVVDQSGKMTAQEISLQEAPPAVQKSLKTCIGEGTLQGLEKTIGDNEITYDGDFTKKDGTERSVTIALNGRVASLEIGVEELPANVRKSADAHLHGSVIQAVYRNYESNLITFQIEFEKAGSSRDMVVNADGTMDFVQVELKEMPGPAQKTVRQKVGNGKIIRIDKTFDKTGGGEPFEIEAIKDGKPFNFSVGTHGKFLGMN
jgi:uncharacterized membrane protein YkoI